MQCCVPMPAPDQFAIGRASALRLMRHPVVLRPEPGAKQMFAVLGPTTDDQATGDEHWAEDHDDAARRHACSLTTAIPWGIMILSGYGPPSHYPLWCVETGHSLLHRFSATCR